jgi:5-methyltetrahydrofolate corrinoid/iron sulfur protein methyltransferase
MIAIGESIHVISPRVREAIEGRDGAFIQGLALKQVAGGAQMLDLNIGPQKKAGPEVMAWMVDVIQKMTDVPLSLDTTNAAAMEAGLKVVKKKALINSTDATPQRLEALMPLAAKYNADIIALTLAATGLPTTADARIQLASEVIFPACERYGLTMENLYLDPLVLTVNGNQDQAQATIEAVRFFKQMTDPPPKTVCGLSNISNGAPNELRPLINRVFLLMMMGAGLDSAIMDTLDGETMEALRVVEADDKSTTRGRLYLAIYDAYRRGEDFDPSGFELNDPQVRDTLRTVQMLENRFLYAHGYLKV